MRFKGTAHCRRDLEFLSSSPRPHTNAPNFPKIGQDRQVFALVVPPTIGFKELGVWLVLVLDLYMNYDILQGCKLESTSKKQNINYKKLNFTSR